MSLKVIAIALVSLSSLFLLSLNITGLAIQNDTKLSQNLLTDYQAPPQPALTASLQPQIQAQAGILVDLDTNTILFSKNPTLKIFPASTTKLATALTALNLYPLDEEVTVQSPYLEGKIMELQSGEKITVKSLVSALLVYSANDAAVTLANHYSGDYQAFVNQMNQLMQKYGLVNTSFINVDGIHHYNHFSTVYDLSQLARLSTQNQIVLDTVSQKQLTVNSVDGQIQHHLISTNELLGQIPEIKGLKTGWTPEAGGCFIGLIDINGHQLISVVAGSDDRFVDTKILVDWVKTNVNWTNSVTDTALTF